MAILFGDVSSQYLRTAGEPDYNFGADNDWAAGFGGSDFIFTGNGDDRLNGGEDRDILSGGPGDDVIFAGAGDDLVYADLGNDVYFGGFGDDTLDFGIINFAYNPYTLNLAQDVTVDLAIRDAQDTGVFGVDVYRGFENIWGGNGRNHLYGSSNENHFSGGIRNDLLVGRGGNDTLEGQQGADIVIGGSGADTLISLADGRRDTFRYVALADSGLTPDTRDTIQAFVRHQVVIDLRFLDADPERAGDQRFRLVEEFTGAPGEVRLLNFSSDTIIQVDGDGDTAVDMSILVSDTILTRGDLLL